VASHFFFGVGSNSLLNALKEMDLHWNFYLDAVMELISRMYAQQGRHVLLTIQLDEFQEVEKEQLNDMLNSLCIHQTINHHLRICTLVQLTGTTNDIELQAAKRYNEANKKRILSTGVSLSCNNFKI
jgi:hypothetical protein